MRPPHTVSLADIYHCLVADKEDTQALFIAAAQPDASTPSAELLVMQQSSYLSSCEGDFT